MTSRIVQAADLFCGGGGFSSGLLAACRDANLETRLLAINHWDIAVATHSANHPGAQHLCQSLESVYPREVVPGGKLDLLLASPECTHHSNARGGKPMSDQSRASAWCVLRWLDSLDVEHVIIENVREFETWGPLHDDDDPDETRRGRPVARRKGVYFRNFVRNLKTLGYRVDWRVLNAADYGDATTRLRLFIQAKKRGKIHWPNPTHLPAEQHGQGGLNLFDARPWRTAREIIDWSLPSESIYGRKRPLAENTLRRIFAGIQRFCGLPFVLPHQHGSSGPGNVRSIDAPLPTVTGTSSDMFLAQPFLVVLQNNRDAVSLDRPLPTVLTSGAHFGLCEPFVVGVAHSGANGSYAYSSDRPLTTQPEHAVVSPVIVPLNHGKDDLRAYPLDRPLPTITSVDAWGLCEPYLVESHGERDGQEPRTRSVDRPLGVVACSRTAGLVQPFLVKFYGNGGARSVDAPLDTITAKDRFALVSPELVDRRDGCVVGWLDIRFRMLQPHELAAAMGFPAGYHFEGTREQRVRQIGNAVPIGVARALCAAALGVGT